MSGCGMTIHHVTLTVTDVDRSMDWYRALLGEGFEFELNGPTWERRGIRWPNGTMLGFTKHHSTSESDSFDFTRVGIDHLALECADEAEVRAMADRFDELGIEHGPVEDTPYAWVVTCRDPDQIAVEFFCYKPQ